MSSPLRASVSLDGKLLTEAGKPRRRMVSGSGLRNAENLRLTIHPLIVGGDDMPTLSGLPGSFLPRDLEWKLVSLEKGKAGRITANYRRT